jgi:hypothetical protein
MIQTAALAPSSVFREALYQGGIFLLPANPASRALVEAVVSLLEKHLGSPIRQAPSALPIEDFFRRLGTVRRHLAEESAFLRGIDALLAEVGFLPVENAVDVPRLRAVLHDGHLNPAAAPAYSAHRDTWYSNPRAQINWWLPLHDVSAEETFVFYPDCFARPVANSSAGFDYADWVARVGWQSTGGQAAVYPSPTESLEGQPRLGFACRTGEVLLFSAAHLHQTRPNRSGLTRFSLDFRTVHLEDHAAGRGAANVDNRSTGSALRDYRMPPRWEGQS